MLLRPPLRVIRGLCIAAILLFAPSFVAPDYTHGIAPGLAAGAAMLLLRPPPRMHWGWHIALMAAVTVTVSLAMVADRGWVAVMVEADGGAAATPLQHANPQLYVAALVGAATVIGILNSQRTAPRRRLAFAVAPPLLMLALGLLPATSSGIQAAGTLAGPLGTLVFLLTPVVALVVAVVTLHKPTIARLQQRAEAAEQAAQAERDHQPPAQ